MTPLDKSKALVAMLCKRCQEGYPCSLCKLGEFLSGCQMMADGKTPIEAYREVEHSAAQALLNANLQHDEKTGYKIEAVNA